MIGMNWAKERIEFHHLGPKFMSLTNSCGPRVGVNISISRVVSLQHNPVRVFCLHLL